MTSKTAQFEQTLIKIQQIIAEITGSNIDEIGPESLLEDLNLYGPDLKRVVVAIGKSFGVYLYADIIEEECETIHDLVMVVHDEAYLG